MFSPRYSSVSIAQANAALSNLMDNHGCSHRYGIEQASYQPVPIGLGFHTHVVTILYLIPGKCYPQLASLVDLLLFYPQHLCLFDRPRFQPLSYACSTSCNGIIVLVFFHLSCVCRFAGRAIGHVAFRCSNKRDGDENIDESKKEEGTTIAPLASAWSTHALRHSRVAHPERTSLATSRRGQYGLAYPYTFGYKQVYSRRVSAGQQTLNNPGK